MQHYDSMASWQHGIMKDLHAIALRGHLPFFIKNFLASTHFRMCVKATYSNLHSQELGVPQGRILAMTLFGVKLNSITAAVKRGRGGLL